MKILLIVFAVLVISKVCDIVISFPLINKFKAYGIFGKPGTGKSTLITKMTYQHLKKGWTVYTNDPTCNIEGVHYYDENLFKNGLWLPDGRKGYVNEWQQTNEEDRQILLCIDEIGSLYNNRDFKNNFTPETLRWWKEHRHRKVKVIYGSQSYKDMDLKIRSLTDVLYIVNRGAFYKAWSVAKPILIKFDIQNNEMGDSAGGQIVEKYTYDIFLFWKYLFLPKWIKKFDSYR